MSDLNLNQIQNRLNELFVSYGERKLIFWFDSKKEFEEDIDSGAIQLENAQIKKIDAHTQFLTKRFFELEDTENNYLIYAPFQRMSDEDNNNHLLSLLKYSSLFNADRISLVMNQLEIPADLHEVMTKYHTFFSAKSRIVSFEKMLSDVIQTKEELEINIMAVLTKSNAPQLYSVIQALFVEYSFGENRLYLQLEKYDLLEAFWNAILKYYGFQSEQPTIQKLIICFYSNAFYGQLGYQNLPVNLKEYEVIEQTNAIVSFMDLFMNDSRYQKASDILSEEVYQLINGERLLNKISIEELVNSDTFEPIHQRIIRYYINQLLSGDSTTVIDGSTIEDVITHKERSHFGNKYHHHYQVVLNAQMLLNLLGQLNIRQLSNVLLHYEEESFAIDQYYRKFIWHIDKIENQDNFLDLQTLVEKQYKIFLDEISYVWNNLLYLNERPSLLDFYDNYARNKVKTVVIISDAFRYEAARELQMVLQKDKKYSTKMETNFTVLPSVTEFGKAALLKSRNQTLNYENGFEVKIDGSSTTGTINRDKILKNKNPNSLAITYDEVISKGNAKELRELFNGLEVIYLYHDQIDKTGDHGQEHQVFDAVQKTIDELSLLLPRISNGANVYRFIITSDHGFIYRRSKVEEHEKIENPSFDDSDRVERRFLISDHLYEEVGITSMRLGEVLRNDDPRYIHYPETARIFKKKGGGQNYVHGGSSPQELLVPVLEVSIARGSSTKEQTKVQLMTTKRKVIGLSISLEFYQTDAVNESVTKAQYQLYFEDENGNRISNEQAYYADSDSILASERFMNFTFDFINRKYGSQEKVYLIMKDGQTNVEMDRVEFVVDNPFAGDFDFGF
ncbi:BREX-1 system phosphatase PglZ type A [Enterococcus eurekensis]|uniref:BREX-1 system phosphatase PglZ type A n=1 Tax=Enterococcus eurekensis TaxID=1159753 RepID=A0ABV9M5H6_9ENTE